MSIDDKPLTSDTPRTDAAFFGAAMQPDFSVSMDKLLAFARQLERELFEATQEANRAHIGWTVRENEIARLKRELAEAKGLLGAANNALGHQAELLSAKDRELQRAAPSAVGATVEDAFESTRGSLEGLIERAAEHPEEKDKLWPQVEGLLLKFMRFDRQHREHSSATKETK